MAYNSRQEHKICLGESFFYTYFIHMSTDELRRVCCVGTQHHHSHTATQQASSLSHHSLAHVHCRDDFEMVVERNMLTASGMLPPKNCCNLSIFFHHTFFEARRSFYHNGRAATPDVIVGGVRSAGSELGRVCCRRHQWREGRWRCGQQRRVPGAGIFGELGMRHVRETATVRDRFQALLGVSGMLPRCCQRRTALRRGEAANLRLKTRCVAPPQCWFGTGGYLNL